MMLDVLLKIKDQHDSTLSLRRSCRSAFSSVRFLSLRQNASALLMQANSCQSGNTQHALLKGTASTYLMLQVIRNDSKAKEIALREVCLLCHELLFATSYCLNLCNPLQHSS